MTTFAVGLAVAAALLILLVALALTRIKVAGPNQAFIITGRKGRAVRNPETGLVSTDMSGQKVVMGASVFVIPVVQKLHVLDLSSRRIPVGIGGAVSAQGITCDLEGVAIVKVGGKRGLDSGGGAAVPAPAGRDRELHLRGARRIPALDRWSAHRRGDHS